MAKVWIYFFVLVWILYLMSTGVYLFSRGFLLSRRVQTQHSTCTRLHHCHESDTDLNCLHQNKVDEILSNVNTSSEYCLPKKTRVILLVIDALKYEFGVYDKHKTNALPFENKLPIFDELLTSQPNNSRLFKFIADAPTTTLQRLKGITTGSLPTFIDIGANFATPEINEDNLIDQVVESNLSAVFMGDSTWAELFPKRFTREYAFPSFNIFDLDTVDNSINDQLPSELSRHDWSLLIAHYLGVDHCGHTYGPLHPEMARKLTEMNAVIRMIVDKMDDETTLFVIGDHGMTGTGDHGGATNDEVTSLLFAYNKKYSFLTNSADPVMDQIDFVPTMANILGIPIPFSNLGSVNLDLVPDVPVAHLSSNVVKMLHSWQNVIQMRYYFSNYTQDNRETFKADMLDDLFTKFYIFSLRVTSLYTNAAMDNFSKDAKIYLQDIAAKCRLIWVRFDASQISQGLLFTVIVSIFIFLLIINLKFHQIEVVFSPGNLIFIYASNACLAALAALLHDRVGIESATQCVCIATSIYSILLFAFLIVQNWDYISMNWSEQKHFSHILSRLTFGFSLIVFYSNSFIIQEQRILCFLLATALIMFIYNLRKHSIRIAPKMKYRLSAMLTLPYVKLSVVVAVGVLLLRVTYSLHRCREEQGNCTEFIAQNTHGTDRKQLLWNGANASVLQLYPLMPLIWFAVTSHYFLRKCGNLSGYAPSVLLARYGPSVAATACGAHFFMTTIKSSKLGTDLSQVTIDAAAWMVFGIFAAQVVILLHRPLLLFVLRRTNRSSFDVAPFGRVVPQIFMKMKRMYEDGSYGSNGSLLESEDSIPIVYGLATVYSSVFWSTCSVFVYVLAVLLGPHAAPGIFVTVAVAAIILLLNAVYRSQICTKLEQCLQVELLPLVAWSLLIHYSFYATSHQPTLSQIDWHSAFVGRTASYDHNNALSAALVLLNTFGGAFITTFLYPLLVISPTALYATFPSLVSRRAGDGDGRNAAGGDSKREKTKKQFENIEYQPICVTKNRRDETQQEELDVGRGELTLYENDDVFIGAVFKVACQLVILQGMRIFSSMLACTIHCRHLMVWKIFAPRFIYEGISTYIMFIAILLAFLLVIRVNESVSRFMAKMSSHS